VSGLSFTKLSSSIVASSIWQEADSIRIVWITLLAMGDQFGRIHASIPGLAHIARVSIADTEKALAVFLGPDPYSRNKDHDGRRIEAMDGGWRLINYKLHRDARDPESRREQNKAAAARKREKEKTNSQPIVSQSQPESATSAKVSQKSAQAEAEAEAEAESTSTKRGAPPEPKEREYDSDEIPEGLSTLQYAFGILESCCIPDTFKLREVVAKTIESLARLEKLEIHRAAETLERRIKAAQDAGETVSTFWFTDSKWRGSSGANNGNRGAAVGRVERSLSAWDRAIAERKAGGAVQPTVQADAGVLPPSGVRG
jgi:hypothetical protein